MMNREAAERDYKTEFARHSKELADEFAQPGTLKYFMLKQGFMPHDEKAAEALMISLIKEAEDYRDKYENLLQKYEWLQKEKSGVQV